MLNNTLKIALIIFGAAFSIYGLYTIIIPEFSMEAGPLEVKAQGDHTQAYAMVIFGVLLILAGLAFKRR